MLVGRGFFLSLILYVIRPILKFTLYLTGKLMILFISPMLKACSHLSKLIHSDVFPFNKLKKMVILLYLKTFVFTFYTC